MKSYDSVTQCLEHQSDNSSDRVKGVFYMTVNVDIGYGRIRQAVNAEVLSERG